MNLHSVLIALGALLPTVGVAFLFYVVIKSIFEGDRNERLAHSRWEAEQAHLTVSTDKPKNAGEGDSAT